MRLLTVSDDAVTSPAIGEYYAGLKIARGLNTLRHIPARHSVFNLQGKTALTQYSTTQLRKKKVCAYSVG